MEGGMLNGRLHGVVCASAGARTGRGRCRHRRPRGELEKCATKENLQRPALAPRFLQPPRFPSAISALPPPSAALTAEGLRCRAARGRWRLCCRPRAGHPALRERCHVDGIAAGAPAGEETDEEDTGLEHAIGLLSNLFARQEPAMAQPSTAAVVFDEFIPARAVCEREGDSATGVPATAVLTSCSAAACGGVGWGVHRLQ